jgi:hypothetical protein
MAASETRAISSSIATADRRSRTRRAGWAPVSASRRSSSRTPKFAPEQSDPVLGEARDQAGVRGECPAGVGPVFGKGHEPQETLVRLERSLTPGTSTGNRSGGGTHVP